MEEKKYKVPPRAHFIWAGGKKVMEPEGIELVSGWIKANEKTEGFVANLWIDKLTAEKSVVNAYKDLFKAHGITVLDEEEAKITDMSKIIPPPLVLRDIAANNYRNEHVAYEIDKLRPNYGSSSDLLRYAILLKEPGFYCDCSDVGVGETGLSILFSQEFDKHVIFVEHRPQQPFLEKESLEKFVVNELGNDTFAIAKGPKLNPVLMEIIHTARKNYDIEDAELTNQHIYAAHSGNNIKDVTIFRTGPELIRQVLKKRGCKEVNGVLIDAKNEVEIRRIRDGKLSYVLPKSNTGNWLNTRVTEHEEKERAFQCVINTIKFEAQHFKILRLDDHIHDILISTKGKVVAKEALAAISGVILENARGIKYTQVTGRFNETLLFIQQNRFTTIFNMPLHICILAIEQQAYLNDFNALEGHAQKVQEHLKDRIQKEGMSAECCLLKDQRPQVKIQLAKQIQLGAEFFEKLSSVLHLFSKDKAEKMEHFMVQRLRKYQEYAKILNPEVGLGYNVDTELVERVLKVLEPKQAVSPSLDQKHK